MKPIDLNFADYTFAQKLQLFETLWDDISSKGDEYKSPEWHASELEDRRARNEAGELANSDWNDAKKRIKKNLSCE